MELRHLRYFVAVADAGTVSRAAAQLSLTQPALSRQIRDLESELGLPLFDRVGRRLHLTAEGENLLERTREILRAADALRERAGALAGGRTGTLRLGATAQTLESLISAFLTSFRGVNLFCAALALAGGLIAAATVRERAATSAQDAAVTCTHLDAIADPAPPALECAECRRTGDAWVHLRMCLTCGRVGCCDGSKNHHATKHFWATGHPIVRSIEPGEDWRWCYVDEIVV